MIELSDILIASRFSGLLKVVNSKEVGYLVIRGDKVKAAYAILGGELHLGYDAIDIIISMLKCDDAKLSLTPLSCEEVGRFEDMFKEGSYDLNIEEIASWREEFFSKIGI
ncbi:MAG: hypothetical protein ACE5K4_07020 [Candidatus Hydrothermarchaeota archaeon]